MAEYRYKVVDFLHNYWAEGGAAIFALLGAVFTALSKPEGAALFRCNTDDARFWSFWGACGGFACTIIVAVMGIFIVIRRKRLGDLEKQIGEREQQLEAVQDDKAELVNNVRELFESYLHSVAHSRLGFGDNGVNSERITIYVHTSSGKLSPVGRFSRNEQFHGLGRTYYDPEQGCIGEVWKNDHHFDNQFPDPRTDWQGYLSRHHQYGVSKTTVEKLSMRSRLYFGIKIKDRTCRRPLGVLIIESTDPNRYTEEALTERFGEAERIFLRELVETLRPYSADPAEAGKEGL